MPRAAINRRPPPPSLDAALAFLSRGGRDTKVTRTFDLPIAGNLIEWATSRRFLDFPELFAHWGQYQLLRDICQLRCPVCNGIDKDSTGPGRCWGKSQTELESEVLLTMGRSGDYACPKCRGSRLEFIQDGLLYDYNTAIVVIGARSGKSVGAAILASYLEHYLLCVAGFERDSLGRVYKQAPGTTFEAAFVASSEKQAEKTIWDYYTAFRERSPWIQSYVKRVKELERVQEVTGLKPWRYSETTKEVHNELAGLRFVSLHSNSGSMAGATRVAAFVDELARFDATESKRGADEVWRVLSMSLKTSRRISQVYNRPPFLIGMKIATSSPMSMDDKMMTLLGKADVLDRMFTIKCATWEFNPFQPRSAFDEDYAEDPVQAERDFGANPPLTETPLIDDVARFAKSIEPRLTPACLFRRTYPEDRLGRQYVGIEVVDSIISPEHPRFVCFDAGASFDSFAGAMGHPVWIDVKPDPNDPEQKPMHLLLTVYDWVFRIVPMKQPKRTVWFDSVVKVIEAIQDCFRITQVIFDRWQSESLIQDIRQLGIQADQENVTAQSFVSFRSDCYGGRIKLLPPMKMQDGRPELEFTDDGRLVTRVTPVEMSAQAVGIYEMVKLSRSEDLKHVFNPLKGTKRGYDSDDVAQVLVGVHRMIQKAFADDPTKQGIKDRLKREQMGGEQWAGGAIARTMSGWAVQQPSRPIGSFQSTRGSVPGYTKGDTFVGPSGQSGGPPHQFYERGHQRFRRW